MAERRVGFSEEWIGDARRRVVRVPMHVGVQQREFGIHRRDLGKQRPAVSRNAERQAGRGDDVQDLFFEMLRPQKRRDRPGYRGLIFIARDLLVSPHANPAEVRGRKVTAGGLTLWNVLGRVRVSLYP